MLKPLQIKIPKPQRIPKLLQKKLVFLYLWIARSFRLNNIHIIAPFLLGILFIGNVCLEWKFNPQNHGVLSEALLIAIKSFIPPSLATISAIVLSLSFLNNRLADMYRRYQSKEMLEARKVVDSWVYDEAMLEQIYFATMLKNTQNSNDKDISNYYNLLLFCMFLNEICFVHRTGNVPHDNFLIGFAGNIVLYYDKLEPFIKHRRKHHALNKFGLSGIVYRDLELDAKYVKYHLQELEKLLNQSTYEDIETRNLEEIQTRKVLFRFRYFLLTGTLVIFYYIYVILPHA
jgi:hypothetical protein